MSKDTWFTAAAPWLSITITCVITAGQTRGPMLLQDVWFSKIGPFPDRRVSPRERRMHASDPAPTHLYRHPCDITRYTRAKIFRNRQTDMFAFSTVAGARRGRRRRTRRPRFSP